MLKTEFTYTCTYKCMKTGKRWIYTVCSTPNPNHTWSSYQYYREELWRLVRKWELPTTSSWSDLKLTNIWNTYNRQKRLSVPHLHQPSACLHYLCLTAESNTVLRFSPNTLQLTAANIMTHTHTHTLVHSCCPSSIHSSGPCTVHRAKLVWSAPQKNCLHRNSLHPWAGARGYFGSGLFVVCVCVCVSERTHAHICMCVNAFMSARVCV